MSGDGLTEQQSNVADHKTGAMLVLAGAGSGKTTVVAHRTCNLLNDGADPERMLMLTFSKKAAREMADRIQLLFGDRATTDKVTVNTFHGFGFSLLRDYPEHCERQRSLSLVDESDSKGLYRRIARDVLKWDMENTPVDRWYGYWSLIKQDGCNVYDQRLGDRVAAYLSKRFNLDSDKAAECVHLFSRYEQYKREDNVCDFDDFVLLPTLSLVKNPDLLSEVAAKYDYITVDEAQDTNLVQYKLIQSLGLPHGNMVLVGDDDQSIYSWRGAEINNIKRFVRDFNPVQQPLERNFRSTQAIVSAAGNLISNNVGRLSKNPFSENDSGDLPTVAMYDTSKEMATHIADSIEQSLDAGVAPSDIAILYRVNRVTYLLEGELRRRSIPYNVVGGMSLFDRKEIKVALAAIQMVMNPTNSSAIATVAQYIPGIGKASIFKIQEDMRENGSRLPDLSEAVPEKVRSSIRGYYFFAMHAINQGPDYFINWVANDGLAVAASEKEDDIREMREMNLEIFREELNALVSTLSDPSQWLEALTEMHLTHDSHEKKGEGVTLSTIHRAKGLEWPLVHVAAMSDAIMPYHTSSGEIENLEEERRLGYVALTRSKEHLVIHHSDRYFFPGMDVLETKPSRFVEEMSGLVQVNDHRTNKHSTSGPVLSKLSFG